MTRPRPRAYAAYGIGAVLIACASPAVVRCPTPTATVLQPSPAERSTRAEDRVASVPEPIAAAALKVLVAALTGTVTDLQTLAAWDGCGDKSCTQLEEAAKFAPHLVELAQVATVCSADAPLLRDSHEPAAAEAQQACALVVRARDIVERQYLAAVASHASFPETMRYAGRRYREEGRIGWHQIDEMERMPQELTRRRALLAPLAQAIGLPVIDEPFRFGWRARSDLLRAIQHGVKTLDLPKSATDTQFERQAAQVLEAQSPVDGPLPGRRGEILAVRALDPAWQPLVSHGKMLRRDRRATILLRAKQSGLVRWPCAVLWLRLEQKADGKGGWQAAVGSLDDDVRFVRCELPLR